MRDKIPDNFTYLLEEYPEEYLDERLLFWRRKCEKVISRFKLEKIVRIDDYRLIVMVLNYFSDIIRLKNFHPDIKKTRKIINYAYSFYWFLKWPPIQLLVEIPPDKKRLNSINELVVIATWISEFAKPLNIISNDLLGRYIKDLLYFFRYRNYNAQSLEAILTAFVLGAGKNPFRDDDWRNFMPQPTHPPLDVTQFSSADCQAVLTGSKNNPILLQALQAQMQAFRSNLYLAEVTLRVRNDFEQMAAEAVKKSVDEGKPDPKGSPIITIEKQIIDDEV